MPIVRSNKKRALVLSKNAVSNLLACTASVRRKALSDADFRGIDALKQLFLSAFFGSVRCIH